MHRRNPIALLVAVLTTLVMLLPAASAEARKKKGACATAASVTADIWVYAGPIVKKALNAAGPQGVTAAQIMTATDAAIRAWNKLVGNKSWAKIGPRRLDFNRLDKGRVVGRSTRMFVSSMPAVKPVTIELTKVGGKGKLQVAVCLVNKGNRPKQVSVFTLDERVKSGTKKTIKVKGAAHHIVKVVLKGKGKVTRSVQYKLRAKM